jgi:hypothetical protein
MESDRSRGFDANPAELLSVLGELVGGGAPDLSPAEIGRRVLSRGARAIGAAGAAAHLVDPWGQSIDIVAAGSNRAVPAAAVQLAAGGEEAWCSHATAMPSGWCFPMHR